MTDKKYLWDDNEWTFELLEKVDKEIEKIAIGEFGLDCFPNQLEVISSEQMMDAYTSHGLPVMYHHWSYGKHFVHTEHGYRRGRMGLAYEIVINSNPCIAYLMEENTMTMQALVIAHAAYGHNSFFKNNYLFQYWTSPDSIIDYLIFARNYIRKCEEEHGEEAVEEILDSCHALMHHGIDKYRKPLKLSKEKEQARQEERERYRQSRVDELWKTYPTKEEEETKKKEYFLKEPQENILYFIEKNSPLLETWERELVRIVRKMAQYFYPQMQTKISNEGWACFWHYTIMNRLWEKDLIHNGAMLEFLKSHVGVVQQPAWDDCNYSGINPYHLGFHMYMDIKRMCEEPTEEDERWFPDLVNTDWLEAIKYAMENFKDESFILQYLSPKLIRDLKLFIIEDKEKNTTDYRVAEIHDDAGYRHVREQLSKQHDINTMIPDIQIRDFDMKGDRTLYLRHTQVNNIPLADNTDEMLRHLFRLWKFDVMLESYDPVEKKTVDVYGCLRRDEEEKKDDS